MKMMLHEKQLDLLVNKAKKGEFTEQDTASTSTSTTQSGGQGYPQVGKWESGVTRGPANQIGVTKWSEIVGANLKRGKANQLK